VTPLQARGPGAGSEDVWRMRKDRARCERDRLVRVTPVSAPNVVGASLTQARCAAAVEDRDDVVDGLRGAAHWSAAALAAADPGTPAAPGSADVAPEIPLAAPFVLGGLCGAMLLRDAPALAILATPGAFERNAARVKLGDVAVGHEAFWPLYGGLFAAVARGDTIEPARIQACRDAILSDEASAIDRAGLRAMKLPPIRLIEVLSTYEPQVWAAALAGAVRAFNAFFDNPDWVALDTGMLALDISALCAIAHDRHGAPSDFGSPFVPAWLVGGSASGA
jgi:hypothetical protein